MLKPKAVICVKGGIVTSVLSDLYLDVAVFDYDVEEGWELDRHKAEMEEKGFMEVYP